MADTPTSFGSTDGHSTQPAARPARCVVLHHARRPTPETLIHTFAARGVEVIIEREPVLALAELGRSLVEHRQHAARHATFHSTGAAQSPHPHPLLILVIVEPGDFADVDELIAAIARAMPIVIISSFEGEAAPGLRLLQRGRVEAAPQRQTPRDDPGVRNHRSRPGLRLTPDHRDAPPKPAAQPAPWLADVDDDSSGAGEQQNDESAESLISQAELAMLLGDDYGFGDEPPVPEQTS